VPQSPTLVAVYGVGPNASSYAHHRIADDGGAPDGHVHFLGQRWARNNRLRLLRRLSTGIASAGRSAPASKIAAKPLAFWKKLINPGPEWDTSETASCGSSAQSAAQPWSRGFIRAAMARALARLLAKSPWPYHGRFRPEWTALNVVSSTPCVELLTRWPAVG